MNNKKENIKLSFSFKKFLFSILRYWWIGAVALGLWAISSLYKNISQKPPVKLEIVRNTRIDLTPEEITSIREIGQWEFLSISTEEMVEWHKTSTFGDRHLVRIYQGTLRLGIDMRLCKKDWFVSQEDSTATLKLPAISLLDKRFIDEANTRSFYEKGTFSPNVYEDLYRKAENAMRKRCLTPQNLKRAEDNAREHFTQIFKSFGFKTVNIEFEQPYKK